MTHAPVRPSRARVAAALALLLACGDDGSASTDSGPASTSTTADSAATTDAPPTTSGPGTTGAGGEGPPIPTGFVKRWPPPGSPLCDAWFPTALLVHGGHLFVGTSCGDVFRSPDGGATLEPKPTPNTPQQMLPAGVQPRVTDFAVIGDRVFVSYRGGLYATDDLGDTWIPFTSGLTGTYGKVVQDMHVVGGALYTASFGAGVHVSPPDAAAFVALNTETADPMTQSPSSTCPNTPGYLDPVTMQPMTFLHGFALADDGVYIYYANKCGGIYRTPIADLPQKSAWEGYGAGLPFYDAYYQDPFAMISDGAALYAGIDDEGVYRTAVGGPAAWTWISQQGMIYDKLDPISWMILGDAVYVGCAFGGVYVTETQGSPWTDLNKLAGGKIGDGADTIYDLAHDAATIYVAGESGLYASVP